MLGHLKPSLDASHSCSQYAYQKYYCGICRSLRKEKGLFASVLINHELTLNLLALSPFLENQSITSTPCPSKAMFGKQMAATHPVIDKVSKLSILLGWIKTTDWSFDSKNPIATLLEKQLKKWNQKLNTDLSASLEKVIADYIKLVKTSEPEINAVMNGSGSLAKKLWEELAVLTTIPIELKDQLALLFRETGKLIFQADAIEDYHIDLKKGNYNPIEILSRSKNNAAREFYEAYRVRHITIACLLNQIARNPRLNQEFVKSFSSAISNIDQAVLKKFEHFTDPVNSDFINSISNFFHFDLQANQCCCHQCCNNCKCPCEDCHCSGCHCDNGCSCPDCHCNCDICNACNCDCGDCCGPKTYKEYESTEEMKKELLKEILDSDLSDSTKNELLQKLDSVKTDSNQRIDVLIDHLNKDLEK
ncbi:DUF5685 family protein [Chondrinema litorale]|uniref:DUF5685 family protein n=1 Tax=Chondrinema litorale TaxID=2994555 RepID=UPI002542F077|nr:DUF5685 family protein [Chondrinema litorale]UZR98347.1 DUF5685 family protein [Chondrinema litorale]